MRRRVADNRDRGYRGHCVKIGGDLITNAAADGIGLKVTKSGGLTRARRQRDMCIAAGYPVSAQDTTGSDIAFAAIVHLAQTVPEKLILTIEPALVIWMVNVGV